MPDYPGLDPNTPNTQHPPPSRPPPPPTLGRTPRRPRGRRVLPGVPCGLPGFGEKVPSVLVAWKVIIPHTTMFITLLQASRAADVRCFLPCCFFSRSCTSLHSGFRGCGSGSGPARVPCGRPRFPGLVWLSLSCAALLPRLAGRVPCG